MKQVLTIAGSDSGGGAGLQADLKTMTKLGVYGASVVTAITAQNTVGVQDFVALEKEFVAAQLQAVVEDLNIKAFKTGMLANEEIITAVAEQIKKYQLNNLVVDPVMVASSGDVLLAEEAIASLREELIPLAAVVTPNLREAKILAGWEQETEIAPAALAKKLYKLGADQVLVKGGHWGEKLAVDYLYDGEEIMQYTADRIVSDNTHGTGCTLSSAIASNLALGYRVEEAVRRGKEFVTQAIRSGVEVGTGTNQPVNHLLELNT